MEPEKQLEHMITMQQRGEEPSRAVGEEFASRLAAVKFLEQLNQIHVPTEFAARLEKDIRSHVRHTHTEKSAVKLQFLLWTKMQRAHSFPARRFSARKTWLTTLGIAAILLLVYVTVALDFTKGLSHSPLSNQKPSEQQLSPSGEQGQKAYIDQLQKALADLSTAVDTKHTDDEITQKLQIVIARTKELRAAKTGAVGTRQAQGTVTTGSVQHDLDQALKNEEYTLHHLLLHVDWSMQLAFTQQLSTLGDTIPLLTNVTVSPQGNGTVLIILTGTGFAQRSSLVINGLVEGTVMEITSTQLTASVSQANWSHKTHYIGILTPNGMANQSIVNGESGDGSHRESDDH